MDSLHNIAADSDTGCFYNPADPTCVVNIGGEAPGYNHVGNDSDCWGCHGFDQSYADGSGPATPSISGSEDLVMTAGTHTPFTLTGAVFTNLISGWQWVSNVRMTGANGSQVTLTPTSITAGSLTVTIPGSTPPGNYALRAVKAYAGTAYAESNPVVISIIPAVVASEAVSDGSTLTITGSSRSAAARCPCTFALILAPWREMMPRLESASTFRYWPLFHELTLADVGTAFAATLRAARRVEEESRAAGRIEGIDAAPLLAEALAWDLGPGGYFLNQLVRHASRRFAARTQPQRLIYPFEMKALEKMLLLGVREGAPQCRLTGYQHTSITPRHTTFLHTRADCAVTPLPDHVVTVGDVTREHLEARGHYPAGLFRTGGALRQAPREPAAAESTHPAHYPLVFRQRCVRRDQRRLEAADETPGAGSHP